MSQRMTSRLTKFRHLFMLKTKFEVYLVIYPLAMGACERASNYLDQYPGYGGVLLAIACTGSVFMAGGLMIDSVDMRERLSSS